MGSIKASIHEGIFIEASIHKGIHAQRHVHKGINTSKGILEFNLFRPKMSETRKTFYQNLLILFSNDSIYGMNNTIGCPHIKLDNVGGVCT